MDDLRISHYLKEAAEDNNDPMPSANINHALSDARAMDAAIQWGKEAMRTIIIQADTLDELEQMWIDFNSMPLKHRRESDWKMMELFGFNNQTSYETQKSWWMKLDLGDEDDIIGRPVHESDLTYDPVHNDAIIEISPTAIDAACQWEKETGYKMMIPTSIDSKKDVDRQWTEFNQMILKHRRVSDWKCMELFGCTNQQMYNYMLSTGNLTDDQVGTAHDDRDTRIELHNMDSDHLSEAALSTVYMEQLLVEGETNGAIKLALEAAAKRLPNYEEVLMHQSVDAITNTFGDLYNDIETMPAEYNDLPYLTPDEMIDSGVFDIRADVEDPVVDFNPNKPIDEEQKKIREWFESYQAYYSGFSVEMDTAAWIQAVREASFRYWNTHDPAEAQKLRMLGWPPDMQFNAANRVGASNRIQRLREANISHTDFIDMTGMDADPLPPVLQEEAISNPLKPVYIVLSEGTTFFSNAIKGITQSPFSHASIALDHSLEHMYSFGVSGGKSGFIEETFKNVTKRLGVYCIFVKETQFNKIKKTIMQFKKNAARTAYGYANILTFLFRIPMERDLRLICSQFVDRMLKVADIDITNMSSSLVAPNTFRKVAKQNNKIYQMYFGVAKRYNGSRTKRLVDTLLSTHKAQPIKEATFYLNESNLMYGIAANLHNLTTLRELMEHTDLITDTHVRNLLETTVRPKLYAQPYCEVKEFPVQFNDDGDLFIRNMRRMDLENEYTKCHRLLVEYEKAGNMEGLKYELAKMWMMIQIVESRMYALPNPNKEKTTDTQRKKYGELERLRARQLNDFKYYIQFIQSIDKEWNFEEYYHSTPFSDAVMKINRPTLKAMDKIIKSTLKSILY